MYIYIYIYISRYNIYIYTYYIYIYILYIYIYIHIIYIYILYIYMCVCAYTLYIYIYMYVCVRMRHHLAGGYHNHALATFSSANKQQGKSNEQTNTSSRWHPLGSLARPLTRHSPQPTSTNPSINPSIAPTPSNINGMSCFLLLPEMPVLPTE